MVLYNLTNDQKENKNLYMVYPEKVNELKSLLDKSRTEGIYNIRFRFLNPVKEDGKMIVETGTFINQKKYTNRGTMELEMKNVSFPSMNCDFVPFYLIDSKRILPFWVEIERVR